MIESAVVGWAIGAGTVVGGTVVGGSVVTGMVVGAAVSAVSAACEPQATRSAARAGATARPTSTRRRGMGREDVLFVFTVISTPERRRPVPGDPVTWRT